MPGSFFARPDFRPICRHPARPILSTLSPNWHIPMRIPRATWLLPCLILLLSLPTHALAQAQPDPGSDDTMLAAGFLDGHPDLLYRSQGLGAYQNREFAKAIERFRKAAWYGDKASQAIVGEMLWGGRGTERDQVMGLVWMDLAAERGYPRFVNTRNGYWNALSPGERQQARDRVDNLYAEYGDAVADPRLARVLRRERSKMTGSRLGSLTSQVQIIVPGHGTIDASRFYDPRYWDPAQYRATQDAFWQNLKEGKVNVGEPEKVGSASPAAPGAPPEG